MSYGVGASLRMSNLKPPRATAGCGRWLFGARAVALSAVVGVGVPMCWPADSAAAAPRGGVADAGDRPQPSTGAIRRTSKASAGLSAAAAPAAHVGSSPLEQPAANDINFAVDQASGLDTACTFRSGGPLQFSIKTTCYVGEIKADGTLKDAAALVAANVVSATAKLTLPGFDVDDDAVPPPPYQPERDRVLFNGQPIGFLRGVDGNWLMNSFDIPIERVRFPARAAVGNAPTPVLNDIVIEIDTANTEQVWCTAIDWATLSIKALSPLILVHDNGSNGGFFDRQHFTDELKKAKVPYDNSISMVTATVDDHGTKLNQLMPAIVKSFGVDSVHLIAHSKGGLDSRDCLARYWPKNDADFKLLSLTTLSSPHDASVLARYGYLAAVR